MFAVYRANFLSCRIHHYTCGLYLGTCAYHAIHEDQMSPRGRSCAKWSLCRMSFVRPAGFKQATLAVRHDGAFSRQISTPRRTLGQLGHCPQTHKGTHTHKRGHTHTHTHTQPHTNTHAHTHTSTLGPVKHPSHTQYKQICSRTQMTLMKHMRSTLDQVQHPNHTK